MSPSSVPMRERILDAAFQAFMRYGYSGASTAQIARMAQVSKRDLYTHFANKQAMLADCVIARAQRMRQPLTLSPPTGQGGLRETLAAFGTTLLLELGRPEVLATYRLAILEAENAPDVALMLDRHGRAENSEAIIGVLEAARSAGLLDGEPAEMSALFTGMLMSGGLLVRMLMRVTSPPTEDEARARAQAAVNVLFRVYGGDG